MKLKYNRKHNYTESLIQDVLMPYLLEKKHNYICPNVKCFGWEGDVISITTSGYSIEWEIKTQRSDFLADKNKRRKHNMLAKPYNTNYVPNRFYYVIPAQFLKLSELPKYAGLLYLNRKGNFREIVKAPLIHRNQATKLTLDYLARGLVHRYLRFRIK